MSNNQLEPIQLIQQLQQTHFTHILNIKLAHNNLLISNNELLTNVKNRILNRMFTFDIHLDGIQPNNLNTRLIWKKANWSAPYNTFIGDLITESPYRLDIIISKHVKQMIMQIEEEIKSDHQNVITYGNDWKIIYHISKPLTNIIPIVDTIGII